MATYYVATTGNDTTGTGAIGAPWLTIAKGLRSLVASDVLYIRAGTYASTTTYGNTASDTYGPGATTWATATKIMNYPTEAVVVQHRGFNMDNTVSTGGVAYFIWEGDSRANFIHELNGTTQAKSCFIVGYGTNHVRFKKLTVRNFTEHGFIVGGTPHPAFCEVLDCSITNNGDATSAAGVAHEHGMYLSQADDWTIDSNYFLDNWAYGIHCYSPTLNDHLRHTITNNRIEGNGAGATGTTAGIYVSQGSGHVIRNNVIIGQGTGRAKLSMGIQVGGTNSGPVIYNNTIYDVAYGMQINSLVSNALIKNNIINVVSVQIENLGTGTVSSNNVTATAGFTTPGSNFTLAVGSAALSAGADVGLAYNGGAPEAGAYESPSFLSGSVENGATSVVRVVFENDQFSPLLPATGVTGFTTRRNGSSNVVTSAITDGVNTVLLTVTTPIAEGDTVDVSYSAGNVTDSAAIGNTTRQPYAFTLTQQFITNNVSSPDAAPATPTGLTATRIRSV